MKNLLLIVLTVGIGLTEAISQSYRLNDTLYLWEMHGADMVAHPEQTTRNMNRFYYGTPARVVDTDIGRYPVSKEVNPGFNISGHWVKVIMEHDTGFVFDGFLSHLKPFDLRSDKRGAALAQENYTTDEAMSKGLRMFRQGDLEEGQQMNLAFSNGLRWNIKKVKSCVIETYNYPSNRLAEAYQFMMAVYSNYFDQNATFMSEPDFIRMVGNKYEFNVKDEHGNRRISLYNKGNEYIISGYQCE